MPFQRLWLFRNFSDSVLRSAIRLFSYSVRRLRISVSIIVRIHTCPAFCPPNPTPLFFNKPLCEQSLSMYFKIFYISYRYLNFSGCVREWSCWISSKICDTYIYLTSLILKYSLILFYQVQEIFALPFGPRNHSAHSLEVPHESY